MTVHHIFGVITLFLIAPHVAHLSNQFRSPTTKCCPENVKNGTSCINCSSNSYCCTYQPHTLNISSQAFCCNQAQKCCGSTCCNAGQVCCSGWKSGPTCCSECDDDGTCEENQSRRPWYRTVWVVIGGISIVLIPLCVCIFLRMRSSQNRRRDAQQRIGQLLAARQDLFQQQQQQIVQSPVFPATFFGIPPHFLENFPIYVYEAATTPSTTPPNSTTTTAEVEPLISENVDDSRVCIICLDVYVPGERIRLLPCVHRFHVDCIDQWLKKHTTCPLCKLDLITQEFQ